MRLRHVLTLGAAAHIAAAGIILPDTARADVLCLKANRTIALREVCKRREVTLRAGALGIADPFGDGSAGPRTVAADETLAGENLQFTDFTVAAGVTLTVSSGTVIRCTGAFTNEGTIQVEPAAAGGRRARLTAAFTTAATEVDAHPGAAVAAAQSGEAGDNSATRFGGAGGRGLGAERARSVLRPGVAAGGGGGAGGTDLIAGATESDGSAGGGSLVVLADAGIVNIGSVEADGASGGPGGGGAAAVAASSCWLRERASRIEPEPRFAPRGGPARTGTATRRATAAVAAASCTCWRRSSRMPAQRTSPAVPGARSTSPSRRSIASAAAAVARRAVTAEQAAEWSPAS